MEDPARKPETNSLAAETEAYISVDVETAGPNPGQFSLLSIGACTVARPRRTFYAELQPVTHLYTAEARAVSGLSLEELAENGLPPEKALRGLEEWLSEVVPTWLKPVFVAFNAPFDWMFMSDYFHRYRGANPFGHKALDIKAVYMGLHGVAWADTTYRQISGHYLEKPTLTHHALEDALVQAEIFTRMLEEMREENGN
jgi:DNA polymerase III epsilon subunit-like protein